MESQNELLAFMDKGEMASMQNRWTFEAAWEVANKGEKISYEILTEFLYWVTIYILWHVVV
jgi:hypothetical protein